jgi:hypothetical protein
MADVEAGTQGKDGELIRNPGIREKTAESGHKGARTRNKD